MKTQLDSVVSEFLNTNQIAPGTVAVPVDLILKKVQEANPTIPVTKAAIGRRLTGTYSKKQQYGTWGEISGLVQCYYLNKSI